MKITAIVEGVDQSLSMDPSLTSFTKRQIGDYLIVELLKTIPASEKPMKFEIPNILRNSLININIVEEYNTQTYSGTIVCGLFGNPLSPYYVPKNKIQGITAFFSSFKNIISITGYRDTSDILIRKYEIVTTKTTNIITLKTPILFNKKISDLPKRFLRYTNAIKAAKEKSICHDCSHVHYAL